MAPSPTGAAVCIAWPRSRSSRAASSIPRLPAAASAEYSPSEWPATQSQSATSCRPLRASSVRSAASEVAISAGWAFSVSREPVFGAFEDQPAQRLAERLVDLLEDQARGGLGRAQRLPHANGLGALSGEDAGECHRRCGVARSAGR